MPTTDITGRVKTIADLDNADCLILQGQGINTQLDLSYIRFEDIDDSISIVKRRKLEMIVKYLSVDGNALTATTTIEEIRRSVNNEASIRTTIVGGATRSSVESGAPKVYIDPLSEFSGNPIDYEDWAGKSRATIRQTAYKAYLDRVADPTKADEVARSQELYNMILSAVREGHAFSMVDKVKDDPALGESGYHAWKALSDWYLDPSQKNLMLEHYSSKLEDLILDNDNTATEFINNFDLYVRKLEKLEGTWSEDKKIREFKKRVISEDYGVEKRTHKTTFADLVQSFRNREQTIGLEVISEKRQRRFVRKGDPFDKVTGSGDDGGKKDSSKSSKKNYNVPFIPGFLFRSFDKATKKNVRKWRDLTNAGRDMAESDMYRDGASKSDTPDTPSEKEQAKKKKGKKQRRLTTKAASGLPDDTVEVKLDTDNEQYSTKFSSMHCTFCPTRYDSEMPIQPDHSKHETMRLIRRSTSVGISRGRTTRPPYAVIYPGATEDLVGGLGWRIVHVSKRTETLLGAISGMGSVTLPKVDAITAVTDVDGTVQLLGFGNVTYDGRVTQHESLLNSHHMRNHGCIVNDIATTHGGAQDMQFKVEGKLVRIPFAFDGDIMKLNLREPTEEELATLGVVWIMPAIVNHSSQSIRRNRVSMEEFQIQDPTVRAAVPEEEISVQDQTSPTELVTFGNDDGLKKWKEL